MIALDDLPRATEVCLINSVRKWHKALPAIGGDHAYNGHSFDFQMKP